MTGAIKSIFFHACACFKEASVVLRQKLPRDRPLNTKPTPSNTGGSENIAFIGGHLCGRARDPVFQAGAARIGLDHLDFAGSAGSKMSAANTT
jgi:hypothetical protein